MDRDEDLNMLDSVLNKLGSVIDARKNWLGKVGAPDHRILQPLSVHLGRLVLN